MAMEVDNDMMKLQRASDLSDSMLRAELIHASAYAARMYVRDITCDGLLQVESPHDNLMFVHRYHERSVLRSGLSHDSAVQIFGRGDYAAFQYNFLYALVRGRSCESYSNVTPQPQDLYTGDFHFRLPFEWEGHSHKTAPLDLATRSTGALALFQYLLASYDVDLDKFIKTECAMADCEWTEESLTILLSFDWEDLFLCCKVEWWCIDEGKNSLFDWRDLLTRIREGATIHSLFTLEENRHLSALAANPDGFVRRYHSCSRCMKRDGFASDIVEASDQDSGSGTADDSSEPEYCDRLEDIDDSAESGIDEIISLPGESDAQVVATIEHEQHGSQHRGEIPFLAYHFLREDYRRRHYGQFSSPFNDQLRHRRRDALRRLSELLWLD
ncbi:hypothetical protein LTR53_001304 [Teratosphaeriaceae sp. CCFEE 6253]|nr:hypothetical protein LTR53_001304 [Teratosphaeriaceae sp. CCFEE 6253]